jgi:hypothetical protein
VFLGACLLLSQKWVRLSFCLPSRKHARLLLSQNLTFIGYLCEICSICENMAICVEIRLSLDICVKYAQCVKIWTFVCKFDFHWIFV